MADGPSLKFCKDCAFFHSCGVFGYECRADPGTSLITGEKVYHDCGVMRKGPCGREARLFQPKSNRRSAQ